MIIMRTSTHLAGLLAAASLCGAGSAFAATWTFTGALEQPAGYGAATDTAGGVTATATAWANTANGPSGINTVLASAYLTPQGTSGVGARHADSESTSSPQHAIDNDGRIESVLFSFAGDKVNLSATYFGWVDNDSDYSVYAYTGAGTGGVAGLTYADLTSNGWSLVGHYNSNSSAGSKSINSDIFSSYWLIGAYNGTGSGMDTKKDYFKLKSVTGATCADTPGGKGCGSDTPPPGGSIPEPGTLLLVGIGMLGLTRMKRRQTAV